MSVLLAIAFVLGTFAVLALVIWAAVAHVSTLIEDGRRSSSARVAHLQLLANATAPRA